MIKSIKELKKFGIFHNYTPNNIKDFNKFNLIYGWNGSGKTTLVELFESLKKKTLPDRFSSAKFSVILDNHYEITENNLNHSNLNLHIFNDNFIKENIDWDNSVKSVLLVAEEKIQERQRLNELNEKQKNDTKDKQKKENQISSLENEIANFMTREARNIKQNLQAIDTTDRYFMNYNKTKFQNFIDENEEKIKDESYLLNEEQVNQYVIGAKPNKKDPINIPETFTLFNFDDFKNKEKEISNLLSKTVVSSTIERLLSNSDVQSWVEQGLKIHKKHQLNQCEFCENIISKERFTKLENHFSKDYDNFKRDLRGVSESVDKLSIQLEDKFPSSEKLYLEYMEDFKTISKQLTDVIKKINSVVEKWKKTIDQKIENPFNTSLTIEGMNESLINNLNNYVKFIKELVKKHNQKTINFEEETKEKKKKLEGHYITEKVIDFDYYQKKTDLIKQKTQLNTLNKGIKDRRGEVQRLENSLSNEGLGAEKINSCLHKFLGRKDLSIQFNEEKKGYDIIRDDSENGHSTHLSEGEKRAIAFIYFIIKLEEKNNKIKDSIIVVDDPISSLDSNNLFQACSFLRTNCKSAKQLFIFTHNFTYFKLIRDWLFKNNEHRKKESKSIKAHFFVINMGVSLPRNAVLEEAPKSLIDYNSEYHYIFEKLFKFKDSNKLDVHEALLTANLSRKLLESFFYFKYPKHRSDLSSLLNAGLKGCKNTTHQTKERIYNFINKYSHSDKIEINDDASENLMGESYNIIGDIFEWIEEVDEVHYKEMVESVNIEEE